MGKIQKVFILKKERIERRRGLLMLSAKKSVAMIGFSS